MQQVEDLVKEVAGASREQADAVEQVNTAVAQMDQLTQSNAASAEETAAASEELSSQSQLLMKVIEDLQALVGGGIGNGSSFKEHAEELEHLQESHLLEDTEHEEHHRAQLTH